ncbi:hypothetical protein N9782_04710 [Emcibacteraceae bacterium]|nr:hypothetical protein [Emcibacteraceae bacterium]
MKLLIITLTFMSISFGVFAQDTVYNGLYDEYRYEPSLEERIEKITRGIGRILVIVGIFVVGLWGLTEKSWGGFGVFLVCHGFLLLALLKNLN